MALSAAAGGMKSLFAHFATGATARPMSDTGRIDELYRRHRFRVLVAITIGELPPADTDAAASDQVY